jgi:hypothetical protein
MVRFRTDKLTARPRGRGYDPGNSLEVDEVRRPLFALPAVASAPAPFIEAGGVSSVGDDLKARELIDSAAFGPDTLKVIGQAFDEAWDSVAGNFEENPLAIQAARLKLANAILAEAKANPHDDVETLKNAALQAVALSYRRRDERGAA